MYHSSLQNKLPNDFTPVKELNLSIFPKFLEKQVDEIKNEQNRERNVKKENSKNFEVEKTSLLSSGFEIISKGSVALFLDFSSLNKTELLEKTYFSSSLCLIEVMIRKIRGTALSAVETFPGNFSGSRDPILLYLVIKESYFDSVYSKLKKNRFYGFKGVVCIPAVIFFINLVCHACSKS